MLRPPLESVLCADAAESDLSDEVDRCRQREEGPRGCRALPAGR